MLPLGVAHESAQPGQTLQCSSLSLSLDLPQRSLRLFSISRAERLICSDVFFFSPLSSSYPCGPTPCFLPFRPSLRKRPIRPTVDPAYQQRPSSPLHDTTTTTAIMAGRYERVRRTSDADAATESNAFIYQVNAQDEDDSQQHSLGQAVPNSPPPSFRSRASSRTRQNQVDPDLADAFESDEDSDDEVDDRQRLVRQAATPATTNSAPSSPPAQYTPSPSGSSTVSPATRGRVVGGGTGTDGVFANMSARPECESATEKDEMPPVCYTKTAKSIYWSYPCANIPSRHTNKLQQTLHRHTGKRRFWPPGSAASMRSTSTACP